MTEAIQDGPDEIWQEAPHEIRPSERDICRALSWIEWPFTGRSGPVGWSMRCHCGKLAPHTPRLRQDACTPSRHIVRDRQGAAEQLDGLMVKYRDRDGEEQRPAYVASKPRGGAIEAYLARSPAVPSPLCVEGYRLPWSGVPTLMPMFTPQLRKAPDARDKHGRYGVAEARADLVALGIDGGVTFDSLPWPATQPANNRPAKGARFVAGITAAKQTVSVPAPNWQMPDGKSLSLVLEEVGSRGTLTDIGEAVRDKSRPGPLRLDRLGKRACSPRHKPWCPLTTTHTTVSTQQTEADGEPPSASFLRKIHVQVNLR